MPSRYFKFASILWGLTIIILTVVPTDAAPEGFNGLDKAIHLAIFAVFSILLAGALKDTRKNSWIGTFSMLFGAGMELLQFAVPGRTPDVFDALFNVAGVVIGLILFKIFLNKIVY